MSRSVANDMTEKGQRILLFSEWGRFYLTPIMQMASCNYKEFEVKIQFILFHYTSLILSQLDMFPFKSCR